MKTDSIFYQIFQTLPEVLFELIGESPTQAEGYQFGSVEIKELAFRFDGIFSPPTDSTDKLIYFVEVQFQKKEDFYWDFFGEIFIYLQQYKPQQNWRAVAIFPNRSVDTPELIQYQELYNPQRFVRIYLNELQETTANSIGLGILDLIVAPPVRATEKAGELRNKMQTVEDENLRRKVIELVDKILVYKFPQLSRQELEAMFGLDELKQTRYFQDVKQEGKIETIPLLLRLGLSVEAIASELNLDLELVKKIAAQQPQQ